MRLRPARSAHPARLAAMVVLFSSVVVAGVLTTELDRHRVASSRSFDPAHEAYGVGARAAPAVDVARFARPEPFGPPVGVVDTTLVVVVVVLAVALLAWSHEPGLTTSAPRRGPPRLGSSLHPRV